MNALRCFSIVEKDVVNGFLKPIHLRINTNVIRCKAEDIRSIKGKTFKDVFKDVAETFGTSPATVIRRFDHIATRHFTEVNELPEVIAIDEYKGDIEKGEISTYHCRWDHKKTTGHLTQSFF